MDIVLQRGPVLGLAERIPNQEALALAPTAGWIMLACAVCAAVILLVHREGWRRLFLRAEDPRSMAVFRIVFGLCAMCNVNGLWELFEYLFTDEGLFFTDVARQVFAREQFQGFGNGLDGDPYGFFDVHAFVQWLRGPKYSLLFFWDSPTAFWIHLWAFETAMVCLIVGFQTRYTKWIAWFLFHSIIQRNSVYWEGTENVYRTFFFYLALSRCGEAYSIDNWLRCRRLRRAGRLSEPGKPGDGAGAPPSDDHPQGLEAIYRRIPAWPRMLVILQCAALYCYTGVVKNGSVWWKGDAFYYALNLDHFYRVPPQYISSIFGTNLFRLNTHVVHVWESFFPLCVFGLVVRFGLRERLPPLSATARWIHRGAWIGLGLGALVLCEVLFPTHFVQPKGSWWTLERVQVVFGAAWILGMGVVAWGWHRLRHRPFRPRIRGRQRVIDLDAFLRWTTGRRLWVSLGVAFHLHLMTLMNIGWFQPGALSGFICFLNGGEIAIMGAVIGRRLARLGVPGIPQHVLRTGLPLPSQDPAGPGLVHDASRMPLLPLAVALGVAVVGVPLHVENVLHYGWTLVGIAVFLGGAGIREARASRGRTLRIAPSPPEGEQPRPLDPDELTTPWAHGPLGRWLASALLIYHITGVAVWLLPDKDSFSWRGRAREPFQWWMGVTQTTQGWGMFAPNPPRSNLFLRVLVTDRHGETWDMNTDVYADEQRPIPWIWYTRQRKINRRIAGGEGGKGSWYQKWHARWFCRQWALSHRGELPQKVELVKVTYPIPPPEHVAEHGPYDPVERMQKLASQQVVYTAHCDKEVDAQLPEVIRARHGLPPSTVPVRRWNALRGKKDQWDRKRAREARREAPAQDEERLGN